MKHVFAIMALQPESRYFYRTIRDAVDSASQRAGEPMQVLRADEVRSLDSTLRERVFCSLADADLVIADVSLQRPNVMYELGLAFGLRKPVIVVAEENAEKPSDLVGLRVLMYDPARPGSSFEEALVRTIVDAINHPDAFTLAGRIGDAHPVDTKPTVFISYSHVDRDFLARLQVHLRPLVKGERIELWDDTRIKAGEKWKEEISGALERAAIAVLLISADFLASDFVVDNELPPLLTAAEQRGTTVLPLILKPCRFTRDEHLSVFQAINNPRNPLVTLSPAEQEQLYADLAERIENELLA